MDFCWRNPTYEPREHCKVRNWQLNTVSTCYHHHHHFFFNHNTICKQCLVYDIRHHLLPLPNIQADKHKRENCQLSLIVWLASQCKLVRLWMCPSFVSAPTLGTFLYLFWKGSQPLKQMINDLLQCEVIDIICWQWYLINLIFIDPHSWLTSYLVTGELHAEKDAPFNIIWSVDDTPLKIAIINYYYYNFQWGMIYTSSN